MFSSVMQDGGIMYKLVNEAKSILAVEEKAQAEVEERLEAVYTEVQETIDQYKSFGFCPKGQAEATTAQFAMLWKATMSPSAWENSSVEFTSQCLAGNPFYSFAEEAPSAIQQMSRVIPKLQDWQAYKERNKK
jgi:hypothetical protein